MLKPRKTSMMKLNVSKNANYLGGVIIILAFAVLYFSYFFVYIPKQENKLQQRAFRILKEYGNNMFDKNNYYKNHFENFKLYYSIRFYSRTDEIEPFKDSLITDFEKFAEIKDVVNGLYNYVECKKYNKPEPDTSFIYSKLESKLFLNYGAQIKQTADNTLKNSIREIGEYYKLTPHNEFASESDSSQEFINFFSNNKLQYLVPVNNLMEGLKFDRLFENIILFDYTQVYYNSKLELVTDITRPASLCDSVENHQGGIWESMEIRGKDKQVMVLPIDFLGKRFYIAGIISDVEYHKKTRTIDNQFIILIAVLLLLVLIGMPILKIIFIGKNERLKSTDASASLISSIFGTGLLILMILGIIKHKLVDHPEIENRLTQISNTLYKNVTSDIDSIKALYMAVSFKDEAGKNLIPANANENPPCPYIFNQNKVKLPFFTWTQELTLWSYYLKKQENRPLAQFAIRKFMESDNKFHMYNDSLLKNIFPINEIILINNTGIIAKAVTSTPFSELVPIDLSQRNYFKNAKSTTTSWPTINNLNFYIESIKSYNTGDGETSISFHNSNCDDVPVTAITSAIPSFYKQVLPKDVEFVIINNTGKVLYHSIKSKNLHENFLDECDFDERIENSISFRTEDIFHIDYNEKRWMLRIVPIEDTPLFHITLIDLEQSNNKNARIFLFTFYFLVIILVIIGIGMLILRWSVPQYSHSKHNWFLEWVLYKPEKISSYLNLSLLLLILSIVQFTGFGAKSKPAAILLYNIIFIVYSLFVSLVILTRKNLYFKHLLKRRFLPENIILIIVIFLVILFFSLFSTGFLPVFAISILVLITISLPTYLKNDELGMILTQVSDKNKKRIYLLFLFIWLICLAVLPVLQSYKSIKNQEREIELQQQSFAIAQKNLDLYDDYYKFGDAPWVKHIQGNGIDYMNVEFRENSTMLRDSEFGAMPRERNSDKIYALLPDPVTNDFQKNVFVNDSNFVNREWLKNDTLFYSKNGSTGAVSVSYNSNIKKYHHWNYLFILVIIFVVALLWTILRFIASVILNLQLESPDIQKHDWIETLFNPNAPPQILLQTFHPEYFLQQSLTFITDNKNAANFNIIDLPACKLATESYSVSMKYLDRNSILWISGLAEIIYETENHEVFLTNLMDICRLSSGKIVIELPFNFDFIDEVYDEVVSEKNKNKEDSFSPNILRNKWTQAFRNFIEFNGFYQVYKNAETSKEIVIRLENTDLQFDFIWNNLTIYEKIVLFDLADDGLVNTKNKLIINRLIKKHLITLVPSPEIVSNDFRNYILRNLSTSTVKALETKLGLKRKWKNTKYLILFILVPLAGFILISQGVSIEKIFGIFAGVLTLIAGVTRLFDSQFFKQSTT